MTTNQASTVSDFSPPIDTQPDSDTGVSTGSTTGTGTSGSEHVPGAVAEGNRNAGGGILRRPYLWATIGSCALVFLSAFESLAVTTIMPLVSRELDGAALYALAFAGPLATGVIGMVAAGNWSDRRGPALPLYTSVALFVAGLLIAGTSTTMGALVAGRLVQGLGGGAITVALYVLVARVYPPVLHAKIFAAFAAAWVIPSLVGPVAAGVVAEVFSWHWVFLGVVFLVIPALAMIIPVLRGINHEPAVETVRWDLGRLGWAVLAAVAVLALNLSSQISVDGLAVAGPIVSIAAVVVAVLAVRPLLPPGTLSSRRGLPSVIMARGLVSAAFFGAEVYLPYLLIERYAFSPAFAGLALTFAALAWAAASAIQGRMGDRLAHRKAVWIGTALVTGSIAVVLVTAALMLPAAVAIAAWVFAGGGMGLMYPRLSVMTLALSTKDTEGFNSSALSIADSLGGALALAATGLVFAAFATPAGSFAGVFAFAAVLAVVALLVAPRVGSGVPEGRA